MDPGTLKLLSLLSLAVGTLGFYWLRDKADDMQSSELVSKLDETQRKLDPFLDIARRKFPSETADSALLKLRQQVDLIQLGLQERRLSEEQAASIVSFIQNTRPVPLEIRYTARDNEAAKFAAQLKSVFSLGKWKYSGVAVQGTGVTPSGIKILYNDKGVEDIASSLAKMLATDQIGVDTIRSSEVVQGQMVIFVGPKK